MISSLFELAASLFDSILAVYFLTKFNYASWRKNYYLIPAILIPFGFQIFADAYLQRFSILSTSIQFFLSLIYALLICKRHYFRAFCATCIYKATLIILSSALFTLFAAFTDDFASLLNGGNGIGRWILILSHKTAMLGVLQLILHFYNRESRGNILNGILTFSFSCITILGLRLTLGMTNRMQSFAEQLQLFSVALVFLLLNLFLYILLSQISKLQQRNYELKLLNEKSKFEEAKYQEALYLWNSAEKVRHDVKHHMVAISGMIENGCTDECQAYLNTYLEQIQRNGKFSPSGNTVIDYLLDSKLSPLENTEIIVTGSVRNLEDIKDTDLASLIGNILDNAIEAEKKVKEKRIELHFGCQNDNNLIICKNHIEKSVLSENRELRSTKGSSSHHGFGHQIVAEIVRKYNGLIDYYEEDGMFGVQIMLPSKAKPDHPIAKTKEPVGASNDDIKRPL